MATKTKKLKDFGSNKKQSKPKLDSGAGKKAAKAAANKEILKLAATLPVGEAKKLMECITGIEGIEAQEYQLRKRKKDYRNTVKGMKIELRHFDEVRKQRKMDKEERDAYVLGVAAIKEQISMDLLPPEKAALDSGRQRREASRKALSEVLESADAGKEVGSAGNGIGHNSDQAAPPVNDTEPDEAAVPEKNEALSSAVTH